MFCYRYFVELVYGSPFRPVKKKKILEMNLNKFNSFLP